MIPGFNETLRHEGATYHIQTEDLGEARAVVVSHIFRNGQILHTARSDYRDRLEHPQIDRVVKKLLILQHRDMQRLILAGEFAPADGAVATPSAPERTRSPVPEDGWDFPSDVTRSRSGAAQATPSAGQELSEDELLQAMEASRAAALATEAAAETALVEAEDPPGARVGEGPPLVGLPSATGFMADAISDRRLDLVVVLELARLADTASPAAPAPQ